MRPPKKRKLVVMGKIRAPNGRGPLATEDITFEVVHAYEEKQGRFTISVDHIRGRDGFGCDIVSVASDEIRQRAIAAKSLSEADVVRFIEVKGSSSRRGAEELTSNEHGAAKKFTTRYFMYRVFVKRGPPLSYELAVLEDPVHSKAVRHIARFDLSEGSGADWFACTNVSDDEGEE